MKVKLLREQNITMPAGAVVDVPDFRAEWLVSVGAAEHAELPKAKKPTDTKKKTTKKKD